MKEAGLEDVKKEVGNLKSVVETATNPVKAVKNEIVADLKKEDENFKKYFGEIGAKPAAPSETSAPAAPATSPQLARAETEKPAS
jgi:hypothetical protein